MSAVSYQGVQKKFDTFTALHSLDLKVPDRSFMALLGPSGCGKTTALRILAGLDTPTKGRVLIGERDVTQLQPRDRDVAMVFQSYALYPHKTVRDNIGYPLWIRKMSGADIAAKTSEVSTILEIEHLLDRRPRQLSGGQRQRVALARAIVRDPAAFLMDEPLSNLDARLRLSMRGELKRLCHRLGATTLYVTHDQAEALTMADLIAVMNVGQLQQVGSPEEIYERPANRFVATFVGSPPMNVITALLIDMGVRVGGVTVALTSEKRAVCASGGATEIGIRPEDLSIVDPVTPGALQSEIYVVEPMGNETLVDVRVGDEHLSVRVGRGFTARVGAKVGVKFDADDACFFDAKGVTVVHRVDNRRVEQ
jgi:multiple sugar transport system ATP-binding protein